jgi:hypothetical protein
LEYKGEEFNEDKENKEVKINKMKLMIVVG